MSEPLLSFLLLAPFMAQGLLMLADEFYFHHKRGLAAWEVWGHPLDTLTVLAPFAFALTHPFAHQELGWFLSLAGFSCVFVVKDEWVHKDLCTAAEMALHALLFSLHPLGFLSCAYLWSQAGVQLGGRFIEFQTLALGQLGLLGIFFLYQGLYWGWRLYGRSQ